MSDHKIESNEFRSPTELALELTLRKKELEEKEERFQLLVTNVSDVAFLILNSDGMISAWNIGAERMFGYTEAEIIGKPFSVLFTPEDIAARIHEQELAIAFEKGVADDDRWHVRKDGSKFWASGITTIMRNGEIRGYAKLVRDLTHIKQAEEAVHQSATQYRRLAEQLADLDRRKDEFLAMLAHELRNPLTPISNGIYLLQQTVSEPAALRSIKIMEKQTQTLTRLVGDLLDVSRITRGKIQLHRESVNLMELAASVVESITPLAEMRQQEIILNLPPKIIFVNADPTRLEQVIVNLMTNAIKYTKPGGHISLTAEKDDHHISIRVKDDGVGITSELMPVIFDLFIQDKRTLDRAEGGLGIGLTLVRRLVELHDGTITAHSDGPGKGSEFIVRLPVIVDTAAAAAAAAAPKLRVLIVDDVPETAETFASLVHSWGFDARVAHDGTEALLAYQTYKPDVGLLDIGLPGMSGYELARMMRQNPERKKLMLIAITGYGGPEGKKKAMEAGFDFHITKPLDTATIDKLSAILEMSCS